MSSRAVKRLLKERGYDESAESNALIERRERELQGEDQATSDSEESKPQPKANMFDLLMGGDDGGDNDESDSDRSEVAVETAPAPKPAVAAAEGKRRAKGKKKGKGKKSGAPAASGGDEQTMEEFEAELAKLQLQLPEATAALEDGRAESGRGKGEALGVVLTEEQQRNRALLVADAKHLDSEAEIRRMFGSAAVKDKGRRLGAASLGKRLTLSHPKANWPAMRAQAGIEMRAADSAADQAEDPTGGSWFVMEHSGRFRSVQAEFLAAVMTHSADGVAAIAHHHPYHVDALLQLSEILKQTGGDFAEAGELVERALYAFEIGFAPRFSAVSGMARLDFRYVESRTLYLALFRHMQFMSRRGCWRTAFEVNKVLLSLDPVKDPYGALLTLDFHALKSRQYEYVCQFVSDWSWSSVDLPNWAFSRALAEFMMERQQGQGSAVHSMELLVQAILKFPTVVPVLWSKANVGVDDVVLTHPYFQDEVIADTSAMTHMQLVVQLFVERHTPLYRTPEVARWMQEGLLLALESIARNDTPQSKYEAQKRLCTYVIPENISRHVLVADLEVLKAGLPEDIRTAESFAFDPLPPKDDVNVYKMLMGGGPGGEPRMPGAFEIDGEVYDMEDFEGEEGMGLLQQMINHIRLRLGGGAADVNDPGTSSDEEGVEEQ
ncbi:hypothetical protein GGI17_000519 [Coemansia sp. S146]|nr:hypothetical protein GGI17_000519 [Coemansia sp. S146]